MEITQHSLFTTKIEEEQIPLENNTFQIIPAHTKYSLYLNDFNSEDNQLHTIFNQLKTPEVKTLEVFISSYGGAIAEGRTFHNIFKNHFPNAVDTYLESHGYSMGALLFTLGDRRIVYPNSDIMFHYYSGGAIGKGHEIKAQAEHANKLYVKYNTDLLKPFFKKKEIKALVNGKDFWMGTEEMCRRNIATHVLVDGELIEAKEYLKSLKRRK